MKRILVVDEDLNVRCLIETLLTSEGHQVASAGSGEEALGISSKRPFDLVLTDLTLPGIDGIELILLLRSKQPQLQIVAMCDRGNRGSSSCLPLATKLGARRTLAKPFDRTTLLNTIEMEVGDRELVAV
jgi:CheY-like chemotaxis protein